jgi:hypothetical protein
MLCPSTNNSADLVPSVVASIMNDQSAPVRKELRNDSQLVSHSNSKLVMNSRLFIGLELSLVPEVEKVFVQCVDNGKEFRVLTVVNERDPNVRGSIYKREQAIMQELSCADFDFQIIARQNRCMAEIMNPTGELAFKRC